MDIKWLYRIRCDVKEGEIGKVKKKSCRRIVQPKQGNPNG